MLEVLHETHLGILKYKVKAKQHMYRAGINSDINNLILKCEVCNRFQGNNIKEPLIPHEIPAIPFIKLGADIAEVAEKYL